MPPSESGFEHINRYWDKTQLRWAAKLLPGQVYVTRRTDEVLVTTLGSCVSACVRDANMGVGGMNHFMLPHVSESGQDSWLDMATRYGSYAMEHLINEILKLGGNRQSLEIKLTGGGRVISTMTDIGERNITFARRYVQQENLTLMAEDLGDRFARKVMYYPATGQLRVKKLRQLHNATVINRERQYEQTLAALPDTGSVELFE
ncbi:MAG: chemoreceptor glutamine deamidase CheD [Methylophaga sp.]|nr:chemoreceptor glutamine deamidase CheD [Methylophaga sp.]